MLCSSRVSLGTQDSAPPFSVPAASLVSLELLALGLGVFRWLQQDWRVHQGASGSSAHTTEEARCRAVPTYTSRPS